MSREAMQMALEALGEIEWSNDSQWQSDRAKVAITALRQALETEQEPVVNEVQLNIIRWWPEGFADRLEHIWKDLIGFIPNYKLYDLQRMLAEYGFTMKLYEGDAPPSIKTWDSYNQKELVYYKFNQEKFAELIVRECGILADQYQFEKKNPNPLATERLPLLPSDFIYKHFGVEVKGE
jgi:hypothetical protein